MFTGLFLSGLWAKIAEIGDIHEPIGNTPTF